MHLTSFPSRGALLVLLAGLSASLAIASPASAADNPGRQALTTVRLKVCADPSNLPYSNQALEGFENRVVSLVADELGKDVAYSWYPQSTGFVRNTLRLRACDLVSGITTTSEQVQNTNPYYQSVYTMVYRTDSGLTARRMDELAGRTDLVYGVVAGTPPADVLARLALMAHVRPYQLVADTRVDRPPLQAMEDVATGVTDVAFVWGPIAGWYAKEHADQGLAVVPLVDEGRGVRMSYRVSMAVRYGETAWKHEVNRALAARADEIESVLLDYGVPLLDDLGRPIPAPAPATDPSTPPAAEVPDTAGATRASGVPEPAGFREDAYNAPTPPGLAGATVVSAAAVQALQRSGATVVDVIPQPRRPNDLPADQAWLPVPHRGIADALWLPDVGFGPQARITRDYFLGQLRQASNGDPAHPLVFYCHPDCWMSWNAAKAALQAGYTQVHWYRDGLEDWESDGLPVAALEPAPGARLPGDAAAGDAGDSK